MKSTFRQINSASKTDFHTPLTDVRCADFCSEACPFFEEKKGASGNWAEPYSAYRLPCKRRSGYTPGISCGLRTIVNL